MNLPTIKLPKFRSTTVAGGGSFALALLVLLMVYHKPALAENDLFKILAQAIVIQGLIGLVLPFYYTAKERPADPRPADPEPGE